MEMEHKSLITELTQGKELALQLRTHLHPASSSQEACFFLTEMIQSSFEKALSLLNWTPLPTDQPINAGEQHDCSATPKKRNNTTTKDVLKKRKLLPRWTEEVKVCSGTAPEGPLNDGYNWRKYGQKDIHGANFPRCYYRCTHRHVRGCLATKQVQRSDSDPNIFEVTYRGRHTCSQSSHFGSLSVSAQNEAAGETNQNLPSPNSQIWFDFEHHDLKVKSEDLDTVFPPFCFPSSSVGSEVADENVFYDPMTDPAPLVGHGGLSAVAVSPAASETEHLAAWDWSGCGGGIPSEQSDLTEIISAETSVNNSPIWNGDWDFKLSQNLVNKISILY
ncbi:probable WRKY transcription factor 46 isoform X2 [Momordica charantia]|uniref:Probable WRKY transcription factor 46 isoform X2 n=1 Tax=Momordica charantia TaxID=3673 RepID=A0A6J1D1X8_MOMCH|nr:probable WRKY transcription factor 46 isoform X2 [Momordica charantia]